MTPNMTVSLVNNFMNLPVEPTVAFKGGEDDHIERQSA